MAVVPLAHSVSAGLKKCAKVVSLLALYIPCRLPRVIQTFGVSRSWFAGRLGSPEAVLVKVVGGPVQTVAALPSKHPIMSHRVSPIISGKFSKGYRLRFGREGTGLFIGI